VFGVHELGGWLQKAACSLSVGEIAILDELWLQIMKKRNDAAVT
jgi:hypothetical protein